MSGSSPVECPACWRAQVAHVAMTGQWKDEDAREVLQLGMGGCAQVDAYMRQCLREAPCGDGMDTD